MPRNTPTQSQQTAADEARIEIIKMNLEMEQAHQRHMIVPAGWEAVAAEPVGQKKTRLTARFDADMVEWYRGLGPGYQKRMNRVLRLFMLHSISGELDGKWEAGWDGALRRVR